MAFRWRSDSGQRLMLAVKVRNIIVVTLFIQKNWSLANVPRREKPVFGGSEKVRFKPSCRATETS